MTGNTVEQGRGALFRCDLSPITEEDPMFEESDLVHSYSRAQAIADGVLIDVSATAQEAGIRWPVALTRAVWERCVRVPPGVLGQDVAGQLWDVLWLVGCAIRGSDGGARDVRFGVPVCKPYG